MKGSFNELSAMQRGLEIVRTFLTDAVRKAFQGKTIEEVKAMIRDDPEEVLYWLIEISLETESYEVCAAARQLLDEKKRAA